MKNTMTLLLSLLALVLVLAGCSLFGYGDSKSTITTDETVTLKEGESAQLAGATATLRFVEKMLDSRCPLGVTCVWEGEVKLLLELTRAGQAPVPFELVGYVGPDGGAVFLDTLGYRFTLERVDPYPVDGVPSDGPATARLKVTPL